MSQPSLVHLDVDCSVDDIIEVSDRDGGVVVDSWLSPDVVERFNDDVVRQAV